MKLGVYRRRVSIGQKNKQFVLDYPKDKKRLEKEIETLSETGDILEIIALYPFELEGDNNWTRKKPN